MRNNSRTLLISVILYQINILEQNNEGHQILLIFISLWACQVIKLKV